MLRCLVHTILCIIFSLGVCFIRGQLLIMLQPTANFVINLGFYFFCLFVYLFLFDVGFYFECSCQGKERNPFFLCYSFTVFSIHSKEYICTVFQLILKFFEERKYSYRRHTPILCTKTQVHLVGILFAWFSISLSFWITFHQHIP